MSWYKEGRRREEAQETEGTTQALWAVSLLCSVIIFHELPFHIALDPCPVTTPTYLMSV